MFRIRKTAAGLSLVPHAKHSSGIAVARMHDTFPHIAHALCIRVPMSVLDDFRIFIFDTDWYTAHVTCEGASLYQPDEMISTENLRDFLVKLIIHAATHRMTRGELFAWLRASGFERRRR